jgi:hypothetical protein
MKKTFFLLLFLLPTIALSIEPLKFVCKFELKDVEEPIFPNAILTKDGELFLLPYPQNLLAVSNMYVIDFKHCSFKKNYLYPESAKYCFIPKDDTASWNAIISSSLFCYRCTFSFKRLFQDFLNGTTFCSIYSLRKDSNGFTPIQMFYQIDTNQLTLLPLTTENYHFWGVGNVGKKGDTLILLGYKQSSSNRKSDKKMYIFKYNFKTNWVEPILSIDTLQKLMNTSITEVGHITQISPDKVIFYAYSQSLPVLINTNDHSFSVFKYQGFLKDISNGNFVYYIDDKGDSCRKFLLQFFSDPNYIILIGGENKGTQVRKDFALKKVCIQFYDKTNLSLKTEIIIESPQSKQWVFFDCFKDPLDSKKLYFLFYDRNNKFEIYKLDL